METQYRSLTLKGTNVLERNMAASTRYIVNQGGSRSSKTYSIAQKFIAKAFTEHDEVFTIARKTLPALKASAMRDFFEVLRNEDLYDEALHNKTENTYQLNGNLIEFISSDQPQKIRGRKRKYLWLNEANEFTLDDFLQFSLRTTGEITLDFNPSDEYHWIYDKVLTRDDVTFIKSTYRDNPFLEPELVNEIERLQHTSPVDWQVFGLGERGYSEETIYTNWQICDKLPPGGEIIYGIDFGFNNATAVTEIVVYDGAYYVDEILYETRLTNSDLIDRLILLPDIRNYPIYADAAEPQRIEEMNRAGFKVYPADKSVNDGIDKVKRSTIYVTKRSTNILKERGSYKWQKDKNGYILDKPVKFNDHSLDAIRYAIHTHHYDPNKGTGKYVFI